MRSAGASHTMRGHLPVCEHVGDGWRGSRRREHSPKACKHTLSERYAQTWSTSNIEALDYMWFGMLWNQYDLYVSGINKESAVVVRDTHGRDRKSYRQQKGLPEGQGWKRKRRTYLLWIVATAINNNQQFILNKRCGKSKCARVCVSVCAVSCIYINK